MSTEGYTKHVDPYDFFAYLMPGLILFAALCYFLFAMHGLNSAEVQSATNFAEATGLNGTLTFIVILIASLVAIYICGHISASLSAAVFDRIYVRKILGYPYLTLFDEAAGKAKRKDGRAHIYRFGLTCFFLPMLLASIEAIEWVYVELITVLLWVSLAVFALSRIALVALLRTKSLSRWEGDFTFGKNAVELFCRLLSLPLYLIEDYVRHLYGFDKGLSEETVARFKRNYAKIFGIDEQDVLNSDVYWMTNWYISENSPSLRERLYKWLSLYGMTRNAATAFFVASAFVSLSSQKLEAGGVRHVALFLFVLGVLTRYYYLYFNYFNKSLFEMFVVITNRK